jgi:hypothetical protein
MRVLRPRSSKVQMQDGCRANRTNRTTLAMSGLPPTATKERTSRHVRKVPISGSRPLRPEISLSRQRYSVELGRTLGAAHIVLAGGVSRWHKWRLVMSTACCPSTVPNRPTRAIIGEPRSGLAYGTVDRRHVSQCPKRSRARSHRVSRVLNKQLGQLGHPDWDKQVIVRGQRPRGGRANKIENGGWW